MNFPDDRLRLIFTCCHPALNTEAQVALTLRTLGGLTTSEIARAFLRWRCPPPLFPLEPDKGGFYVRQRGYKGEEWDLFCLDPRASARPAVEALEGEIALAAALRPGGLVAETPAG